MLPTLYNLPTGYAGDTYGPLVFYFNDISGNPISLDGASAASQVRNRVTKCVAIEWTSLNGGVVISGNQLVLSPISGSLMEIPPDTYEYDLQIDSSGVIRTYIRGEMVVSPNVTQI